MTDIIEEIYKNNYVFPILYNLRDIDKIAESKPNVAVAGRVLNILNLKRIVDHIKAVGKKKMIVDIDLIGGLSNESYAIDYISKEVGADGIISTHGDAIISAKRQNLITILKVFAYDEYSVESAMKVITYCKPHIIEALPGVALPYFIKSLREVTDAPINASGLTGDKLPDLIKLIKGGASAIQTGNTKLWNSDFSKYFNC